ncbi:MMPL family transporter [Streptomyces sp. MMS24-I31]|uniref:MMPL family transporter n=1 Tax=Streptomyces sp. MMS24-I31 TaxID=3351563 RepID=UPI0038969E38
MPEPLSAPAHADTPPSARSASPATGLALLGGWCARHPALVIAAWSLALIAALAGRHAVAPTFSDQVSLSGAQSTTGADLLAAHSPGAGGSSGRVVFHSDTTSLASDPSVTRSVSALAHLPHVTSASEPVVSTDGHTACTTVRFNVQAKTLGHDYTEQLDGATRSARDAHLQVAYGGDLDQVTRQPANDRASELAGVAVALLVLLLAFGSVLAALLPLASALIAVGTGLGVVGIVAGTVSFATSAPTLATMIGLGVGIDYALFLTTRFRQDLIDGKDPVTAAARTTAASGRAVLVAGITVIVAMLSLYACGLSFIGKLGFAASLAVAVTATAAVTLVPAALSLTGRRIDRLTVRRPVAETSGDRDGWHRYATRVARHPWRYLAAGTAVLALLAVPALSMRLGHVDASADPAGTTSRTAYDLVADASGPGFGPGANAPLTVVVDLGTDHSQAAALSPALQQALQSAPGVAQVTTPRPSPDGRLLTSTVTPGHGPQDAATTALVTTLVHDTLPSALRGTNAHGYVTGTTAAQADFRDTVQQRLPVIIATVLAAAFLLLTTVFRSLVIPLKAVLLNLATTAASYGVLTAVFQWGWGSGLLGLHEPVPIESYVPMMMFAIVFGLSMDYEIFLLSRIADVWRTSGDNTHSVGTGLATTGRVISSAALIMTAVFLSFSTSPTVVVKMLALGLAVSVVLDATLVRLVLVPSSMFLLGRANWWLPKWLDRRLPHLHA